MKKKPSWIQPAILWLLVFSVVISCSNDNDEPDSSTSPGDELVNKAPLEVAVVFEPGHLGDKGTNDLLQKQLADFATSQKGNAVTQFISMPTLSATTQAVRDWVAGTYDKATRQHRLLVLTSPALGSMLSTGLSLRETDRVLMLSTPLADAKKAGPAGRTHVMNVSLADGVNRFIDRVFKYYEQFYDMFEPEEIHDGPYRVYHLDAINYADSIVETMHKRFPQLSNSEDGIWSVAVNTPGDAQNSDAQELAYLTASLIAEADGTLDGFTEEGIWQSANIVSLGVANQAFDYFFFSHRKSVSSNLLVGELTNVDTRCDYISPRFPLKAWLDAWAANPDGQPEEQWHGAWDGCAVFTPGEGLGK